MQDEIKATIQLDKLNLCCFSTIKNNFNHETLFNSKEGVRCSYHFGYTTLSLVSDNRGIFKYCYRVTHGSYHIGTIKFGLYGKSDLDNKVWFNIHNKVFYNGTLQFLPVIFENLNLKLHNVTRIEIALDSYFLAFESILRRNIRNKENRIKLMGRYIDRKKRDPRMRFFHYGSPDNPFMVRTVYIKNKRKVNYSQKQKQSGEQEERDEKAENTKKETKTTIELIAYDKGEEIDDFSPHKTYILDYHKEHNPNYKNIYREEIRLESEELRRFREKREKQGKTFTLTDLLSKEFLYEVFTEYIDRIIVIRDSKNQKIDLFPKPFLGSIGGKLPLTLPQGPDESPFIEYNDIPFIENRNKDFNNIEYLTAKFFNNQDYN